LPPKKKKIKGRKIDSPAVDDILDKDFVQVQSSKVYNELSPRGKAIFQKNHLDNIDKTVKGLKEAKAEIAPNFAMAKSGKKLTKPALKRTATGSASKLETEQLREIEKQVGTNFVEQSAAVGAKTTGAKNELQKIMNRQEVGRNVARVGFAGGALAGILNAISRSGKGRGE